MRRAWEDVFGDEPPVGWHLRRVCSARWVRFHSLPGLQRYPVSDAQRATLLDRQLTLGDRVLGRGASCVLAAWLWDVDEGPLDQLDMLPAGMPQGSFGARWRVRLQGEDEPLIVGVADGPVTWSDALTPALLHVAEGYGVHWLLLSQATGAVFAPYDGGVDLVVADAHAVSELKQAYASWLSPLPSGL